MQNNKKKKRKARYCHKKDLSLQKRKGNAMKKNITCQRVESLREWMRENGLQAFIFPSTDPHCGEYIPDHWKTREWISGFDGSAGTAVVTLDSAALWTDSRYFLAAAEQLKDTPFTLMKMALEDTPTIAEWLGEQLEEDDVVGLDGSVNTVESTEELMDELLGYGIEIETELDPAEELWVERPEIPTNPVEYQPYEYAGDHAEEKMDWVRAALRENKSEALIVSQLDEIAWLLNLRGTDVHCCPVFVSYVILTQFECTLYIDERKLTDDIKEYLKHRKVNVKDYYDIWDDLAEMPNDFMFDPRTTNYNLFNSIAPENIITRGQSPIAMMKAVKNKMEIWGYQKAMQRDGVALVKFLRWLKPAVEAGGQTEMSIDRKLTSLRAEQELFRDISFDTIAGYGPHGAIVHYEATPETDATLEPHGLLLLDSGAQYQDGTTDITRTIALGPLTEEERHDYTLVLRGHIRLAMVKFPAGSSGTQLDVCARYAMWQEGINYLHGTGHGVGSYLNVHEGPHQFRMNYMPAPLQANMTITNEPGIYKAGKHGVRIENTMLITHYKEGEFGEFLQLKPLTLCPIDTAPINLHEMQQDEIDYLNWYHSYVFDNLIQFLSDEEDRLWLAEATKPLSK